MRPWSTRPDRRPTRVPLPVLIAPAAVSTALALRPVRRPFAVATAAWVASLPALELPLHVGALAAAATAPTLTRRPARAAAACVVGAARSPRLP